ncbi:hypothetical protein HPB47_023637 [Ixodes persulcatus]|uniref:Uncharacterized protein n=1 Tax=Ixodes persulcatus TaxID=34615 RepID=A0AC60Q6F4_IXOPE|nr:hypothetical protein HPB47_023637 [Ixodes persulcatus]
MMSLNVMEPNAGIGGSWTGAAAFQCRAVSESRFHIEVASTPGSVIVAVAAASPACLSPFRSPEGPAPRLLAKMAAATVPLLGPVSKPTSSSHPVTDPVTASVPHGDLEEGSDVND